MKHIGTRRSAASWLLASLAALGAVLPDSPVVSAASPAGCVDGFRLVSPTDTIMPEAIYGTAADQAIAVGGVHVSGGKRAARIATYRPDGWRIDSTLRVGTDAGYVGLGGTTFSGLWAVGFVQTRASLAPLVVRRQANGRWQRVQTPRPSGASSTLTDVAAYQRSSAWAVGYRLGRPGRQLPYALLWSAGRWSNHDPILKARETGALSGVSSSKLGGTWVAGTVGRNGTTRPYIARRNDGRWLRQSLPFIGDGALAAISVDSPGAGWAAGYQFEDGLVKPLLLRWDGTAWKQAAAPHLAGDTLLFDVTSDGPGSLSVAGSSWDDTDTRMKGFVATRQDGRWLISEYEATPRHSVFTSLDGDPSKGGWLGGRDLKSGVAARTCALGATASAAKQDKVRLQRRRAARRAGEGASRADAASSRADAASSRAVDQSARMQPTRNADLARETSVRLAAIGKLTIQDRAAAVGLPTLMTTHGAVVTDFDGDGRPDIFLNGHSRPAALFLARGTTFMRSANSFGWGDRHGCAAADVDGSGLPDLYCSFGGGRGLGVKGNQLWLDPGAPKAKLAPDAGGAAEPIGRGRAVAFMDVDNDGRKDLVVGQQQNRLDGLPSTNRIYLRNGVASFKALPNSGIDTRLGVTAIDTADVDGDGRVDLLLVYSDPQASGINNGLKLYRNTPAGFRDVTTRLAVTSIGERDAELVRLDADDRPDLVQLSPNRIRVSLQRGDRFKKVYERRIPRAVAVAAGDADGDGDLDLYVLRQKSRASTKDLILFNRGGGRSFRVVAVPSRHGGKADDVFPIDHDGNGLTDFLVLNGGSSAGPVQLISFFR